MNPSRPARTQSASAATRDAGNVIPFPALSAQERACLELAANGHDTLESSRLLSASAATFIAEATVRSVQMRVRHKLKARSLAHAVAIALDRGLIELRG